MGRGGRHLGTVSQNFLRVAIEKKLELTSAVVGDLIARRRALHAVIRGLVKRIHAGESPLGGEYVLIGSPRNKATLIKHTRSSGSW